MAHAQIGCFFRRFLKSPKKPPDLFKKLPGSGPQKKRKNDPKAKGKDAKKPKKTGMFGRRR